MTKRPRVNVKVERGSTFTYTREFSNRKGTSVDDRKARGKD